MEVMELPFGDLRRAEQEKSGFLTMFPIPYAPEEM